MRNIACVVLLLSISGSIGVFGQDDVVTPSGQRRPTTIEQIRNRDFDRRRAEMARVSNLPRERSTARMKGLSKKERKRFKDATTPSSEDLSKFRTFLKQKNTGIFRLLSDFGCETKEVVRIDGDCEGFVPGTWTYSFRAKDYSNQVFHDIAFKHNNFISNGLLSQAIIVNLGDRSIDGIELTSSGMEYLAAFVPSNDKKVAKDQFKELLDGVRQNGYLYANSSTVQENATYAIRIVAYRFQDKWSSRLSERNGDKIEMEELIFRGLEFDSRDDVVFVFRVVRNSEGGDVTIIWKRLSKVRSPKLVFRKDEKLRDF